jgi:two-component system response regulator YesN
MILNWYYRLMLSYTPIFFVVISSVIIVFFTTLNHQSESRYLETNRSIVTQMMKYTEVNLKLIERNAVSALITDQHIMDYFSQRTKNIYDYYVIQKRLIELKSSFPFESSIYMYRESNQMILSDSSTYSLDSFADSKFLRDNISQAEPNKWTEPREYTLFTNNNGQKVVSLMKKYKYPSQQTGIIVINIYVNSMMEYLNQFGELEQSKIHILDSENKEFHNVSDGQTPVSSFQTKSDYTGWAYSVESVNAASFSAISQLSNIWFILVLVIIVLALIWFTIITHIHYKPIHNLVEKINSSIGIKKGAGNGMKRRSNEFNIIESAFENLLQKSMDYNSLQQAEAIHRKRIFIQELIAGQRVISASEWDNEAPVLGLPIDYDRVCALSIEIDRYHLFSENYKPSDQHLLKYILESALKESASERNIMLHFAWTDQHQAAVVLFLKECDLPYEDKIYEICNVYKNWIQDNLEFTISVGIGACVENVTQVATSYRIAVSHVCLKAVFGTNSVIDRLMAQQKSDMDTYVVMGMMPEMIHLLRKGDDGWRDKFEQMVGDLRGKRLGRSELVAFITSLMLHLDKEISFMPPDIVNVWESNYRNRFEKLANLAETLSDFCQGAEDVLGELAVQLKQQRESNSNKSIAMRMKAYIDHHFADSDLSLVAVSDTFDLPSTNASILFKKETGEKFIDYVLKVRLEHARKLLVDSDDAIQIIAERVGYAHVLSFHRAFKKIFGFPPGEYRAIYRTQRKG